MNMFLKIISFLGLCVLAVYIVMFFYYWIFKHNPISAEIEAEERLMELEEGVK